MVTTTNKPPCHHRGARPLIFALLALPLATHGTPPVSAAPAASPVPRGTGLLQPLTTHYPKRCKGSSAANSGPSGVCLLASTSPKASGEFRIRPVSAPGQTAADQPLPINTILALPPGNYEIFKATGIDNPNTAKVTVRENQVETVKTMTLRFVKTKPTATYKILRFQPVLGTYNGGCLAEFTNAGVHAYLPGNFVIQSTDGGAQLNPNCEPGGVSFNAVSGQAYTVLTAGPVTERNLSKDELYLPPDKVSALTSVSPGMHGIVQLGWISEWRSHRGIQNPEGKARAALALYGPGNYTYVVPFTFQYNRKVCGRSLNQGLLPKADLLTECTFKRGRLTGFTVNKGSYFTYHNVYGTTGISANGINNAFTVKNVNFTIPNGG